MQRQQRIPPLRCGMTNKWQIFDFVARQLRE